MQNKITTVIPTLLLVMIGFTGIAAAEYGSVTGLEAPESVPLNPGATVTQSVNVTAPKNVINLTITGIYDPNGNPFNITKKFTVTIDGDLCTVDPCSSDGGSSFGPWPKGHNFTVTYTHDKNAPNGDYTVLYTAYFTDSTPRTKIAKIMVDIFLIPEFPTVALPIAAVIGLVFFFQHRKKRED